MGPKMRGRIISNAYKYLERTFIERQESEVEIRHLQNQVELFIAELKKADLLKPYHYQKYFGLDQEGAKFNIGDRLARLYKIRDTVLSFMDEEVAANITDEFLVRAMNQWIFHNEQGNREGFFNYLREMGYMNEPYQSEPSYGWVLIDTIIYDAPDVQGVTKDISSGSASYTQVHDRSGDVFAFSSSWTIPKDSYQAGELVESSLSIQIDQYLWEDDDYPYFHVGLNYMFGEIGAWFDNPDVGFAYRGYSAIRFLNKEEERIAGVYTDYGVITQESQSDTYLAIFPEGYEEGQTIGIHVFSSKVGKYVYVYQWRGH